MTKPIYHHPSCPFRYDTSASCICPEVIAAAEQPAPAPVEGLVITDTLDLGHSEPTLADAIADTCKRFPGLSIIQLGSTGGGGWPVVRLVGTFKVVLEALVSEDGWALADETDLLVENIRGIKPFEI